MTCTTNTTHSKAIISALLCMSFLTLPITGRTQVERPAANAAGAGAQGMNAGGGMGAGGPGRTQVVTPPDPAVAADPRNFSGLWKADDSGFGGGMGAGGPGDAAPGAVPAGAPPQGMAASAVPGNPAGGAGSGPGGDGKAKLRCIPQGSVFAGGEGGVQIIQIATQLNIIAEENHRVRRIFIGAEQHPANLKPSYMGHSIGRWDGNTLVIDTVGVKNANGADSKTHTIERLSKTDQSGTTLEIKTTNIDAAGRATEGRALSLKWNPGRNIAEWICEDYSDEFYRDDYK